RAQLLHRADALRRLGAPAALEQRLDRLRRAAHRAAEVRNGKRGVFHGRLRRGVRDGPVDVRAVRLAGNGTAEVPAVPGRRFPSTFPRFRSSLRPARTAFFRIVSSFASPCSADFLAFVAPGALAGLCSGLARCRAFSSLAMLSSISRSCAPSPRKSWAPPSRLYFACKDRSSALTALASARTFSTCGLASSSPIAPAKAITLPCTPKMARVLR